MLYNERVSRSLTSLNCGNCQLNLYILDLRLKQKWYNISAVNVLEGQIITHHRYILSFRICMCIAYRNPLAFANVLGYGNYHWKTVIHTRSATNKHVSSYILLIYFA